MRLLTFTYNGATRAGALRDADIVDLNATDGSLPADMLSLLRGGDALMAKARKAAEADAATIPLTSVKLESPILIPPRILAIGLNYGKHFEEIPDEVMQKLNLQLPKAPIMFNKQNTSANGPYDDIALPAESADLDYEGELGVVIGKAGRRVSKAQAFDMIAGYTAVNDVTIRDWQLAAPTMTMGKSWDTHCPMGPVIVTKDELTNPEDLNVKVTVDGEERQNFNTGDMLFDIASIIEYLSIAFTLVPGDVIATGTSAGVAMFREGTPWLTEGQVVRVEIEQIGYLENQVVRDEVSFIR